MFDNLGTALGLIRDLRGKSQSEVARAARIGKSQLSRYESGKELPKLDTLARVLQALEVGPFEVFYTMHLIDMGAQKLDLREEARVQALPPLILSGRGLLADPMDEAFERIFRDVLALYHEIYVERLRNLPRKH